MRRPRRDAARLHHLIAHADVLVHNFTPEATAALGISESEVREIQPQIVYLYLNAFGTTGPWARHRGYAELANLTTGITERSIGDQQFDSGRSPLIDNPRWFFTDYAAGVLGAFGGLCGLYRRSRTGRGCAAETSLVRAASLEQLLYMVGGARHAESEPRGLSRGWHAAQQLYPTADGHIFAGAAPDRAEEVRRLMDGAAELTSEQCCFQLRRIGVAAQRVASLVELMAPGGMAQQRGLRIQDQTPDAGAMVMPGPVIRLDRTPMQPGAIPGPFGGDTGAITARWR